MEKPNCNPYDGGKVPPCSAFLNNDNPIIKDGKLIYRNQNRLFYFIRTAPKSSSQGSGSHAAPNNHYILTNLQISLETFIIGLFIDEVQLEVIKYDKECVIHSDETANAFIHEALQNSPKLDFDFIPTLSTVLSNGTAILPLFTYTLNITHLNYFILFVLNRLEGNPGLFFGNNSFATEDAINFALASLNIQFPLREKKHSL